MIVLALIDAADEDDVLAAYVYQSECHRYWCDVAEYEARAYEVVQADLGLEPKRRNQKLGLRAQCILRLVAG